MPTTTTRTATRAAAPTAGGRWVDEIVRFDDPADIATAAGLSTAARTLTVDGPLRFDWHEQSPDRLDAHPLDRGYLTHLLAVTDTRLDPAPRHPEGRLADQPGDRVAYLRISWISEQLAGIVLPTVVHWLAAHGWCGLAGHRLDSKQVWRSVHSYTRTCPASLAATGAYVPGWNLREEHVPSDPAVRRADVEAATAVHRTSYRRALAYNAVPSVAYANVAPELRRNGLGSRMYELAARELGSRGQVLRASGVQSDHAQALWAHFATSGLHPMSEVTLTAPNGTPRTYPALDYRPGT